MIITSGRLRVEYSKLFLFQNDMKNLSSANFSISTVKYVFTLYQVVY